MSWTPATSIRTRAAHPSTPCVWATSGVCESRPGREHRELIDPSQFHRRGPGSSPRSVRLFSRRSTPLSPLFSTFAHHSSKDRADARAHPCKRKWAYSAQFWGNVTPFRINTCKSVSKQRTSTSFRMNTYEKTPGGGTSSLPPLLSSLSPPLMPLLAGGALSGVN